ncbi:MAG TPA: hypothetical protein VEX70_11645 [Pyrinomonadaceae bacterium]|nr:hypothetical protein [Pyrinomonadaceae bacterium]
MNSIWIDFEPNEISDSLEAKLKFSKVEEVLKEYQHKGEHLGRKYRWKISDIGLEDVKAHARGINTRLNEFLNENEFLVSLGEK